MESALAQIAIFDTNRRINSIRVTDIKELHCILFDLRDRLLIIKTMLYSLNEMINIMNIRTVTEIIEL